MSRDRALALGTVNALLAASLFGTLGPLSRFAGDAGGGAIAFTAWRALLGMAFLIVIVAARRSLGSAIGSLTGLDARGRASLAIAALMGLGINVAMFSAFSMIPIALALLMFYTYPAGVAVIDVLLGNERVSAAKLVALGLSSAGVALVLAGSMDAGVGGSINGLGVLLGLGAAACQVAFVTISRNGYKSVAADTATVLILFVSVVGAVALAVLIGEGAQLVTPFGDPATWPVLLAAGVLAGGVSTVLFLRAIRLVGGTRTGILMLFEPVVGVFLAALLLSEPLVPVQLLGGALVLAGAAVLQLRSAPDHEPLVEVGASPMV
jgi:drug/metabolite transporter (DMT)-like permease